MHHGQTVDGDVVESREIVRIKVEYGCAVRRSKIFVTANTRFFSLIK